MEKIPSEKRNDKVGERIMKKWMSLVLAAVMLMLSACGAKEQAADVDLGAFYGTLEKEYGWGQSMVDIEGEMLDAYYPGLKEIPTVQLVAKMPMMSSVVNEMVFLQCETEADAEKAEDLLQDRIDYQVGDENNPGGAWYPESIAAWEEGEVIREGVYVAMIASAEYQDAIEESFDALFQ